MKDSFAVIMKNYEPKCRCCRKCDGRACINEMPGMGGVFSSINFRLNVEAWEKIVRNSSWEDSADADLSLPELWLAPMTGGVENVGYKSERDFYFDLIAACSSAGLKLSVGDGVPDEKLMFGLQALKENNTKGAVFIKPYPDEKIFSRIEAAVPEAELIGIDIDSYAIITMRNLVKLEKKGAASLKKIKERVNRAGLPFAIKGIFLPEDIALAEDVKPDTIIVSNHGGRIETREGSTAEFLDQYGAALASCCESLWVDGGLRRREHLIAAGILGADAVMIGRPFVAALLEGGVECVREAVGQITGETMRITASR